MAHRYPLVQVDPSALYLDDGNIVTGAGSAAALGVCVHLVRKDHGARVANLVARRLVIPPHREGGQAQFIETSIIEPHEDAPIATSMASLPMLESPDIPVEKMAAAVGFDSSLTYAIISHEP